MDPPARASRRIPAGSTTLLAPLLLVAVQILLLTGLLTGLLRLIALRLIALLLVPLLGHLRSSIWSPRGSVGLIVGVSNRRTTGVSMHTAARWIHFGKFARARLLRGAGNPCKGS
jgi:hypothetical protein